MNIKKHITRKTVGLGVIAMALFQLFAIKHLHYVHGVLCAIKNGDGSIIDCIILVGFPLTLVVVSLLALWVVQLKDNSDKQNKIITNDRSDLIALFNSIDEIVYITDPFTHELLFVNKHLIKVLSYYTKKELTCKDLLGTKCYKTLQGLPTPCKFCSTPILFNNGDSTNSHVLEYKNELMNRWFRCISKSIMWKQKPAKLEYTIDITNDKEKFDNHDLSEHRMMSMINALTDAYVLFEPIEDVTIITGWKKVLSNTKYDDFAKKIGRPDSDCIFPKRTSEMLKKLMIKCFVHDITQIKKFKVKDKKISAYIYKANHGVALNMRIV